ncbi:MAG: ABC transporter permease [Bifidobacterium sp.]|nr:ABC transporter permease [Bifidobacterium sp.]
MSTFKATAKVLFAQKGMLLLYVVALSLMMFGLVWSTITSLASSDNSMSYDAARPEVALVNRDGADGERLLAPMRDFLARDCDLVDVGTSSEELQTAVASNYADLIVIVPEGFVAGYAHAIADGADAASPELDVVTSYTGALGTLARLEVEDFLSLARTEALGDAAGGTTVDAASLATAACAMVDGLTNDPGAFPAVAVAPDPGAASDKEDGARIAFVATVKTASYPLLTAMLICTALAMATFGRGEVRRRLDASPRRTVPLVGAQFAACAVFGVAVGVFYFAIAVALPAIGGLPLSGIPAATLLACLASMVVYALMGVAAGFMVGMLSLGSVAINAIGNVLGLAIVFTSGMGFPIEMMPQVMIDLGKLLPGWWFVEAAQAVSGADGAPDLVLWARDTGLVALFGLAFICLGLVFSRYRRGHPRLSGAATTQLAEA